jgi:hypothetical protein
MKLLSTHKPGAVPNDVFMEQFPGHEKFEHHEAPAIKPPHIKPPHVSKPHGGAGHGLLSEQDESPPAAPGGLLDMGDDSAS